MISSTFKSILNDVASKCTSVEEFKLECAVRGLHIPVDEMSFLKWFHSIAFGTRKNKSFLYPGQLEWKKRFWAYITSIVDDVMTQEKFNNLAKTDMMIKAIEFDYEMSDQYFVVGEFTYNFRDSSKPSRRSNKEILRYAWKIKNKLSMHPVNRMLMLAYAKKHGGLHF